MKVFLDTNVLVAAFTTRGLCADVVRLVLGQHVLLTGEVNIREFRRVLRERMKVPTDTIKRSEQLLRSQVVVRKPKAVLDVAVRDPDDAWVLASAASAEADVLVTGDRDLLEVPEESPVPIVTPRAFWEMASKFKPQ